MSIQLSIFPETREEMLEREVIALKAQYDKLRKSLHAKSGSQTKEIEELKHMLNTLTIAICKGESLYKQSYESIAI